MAISGKDRWDEWEAIYEGVGGLLSLYEADPESRGLIAYFNGFKRFTEDIFAAIDNKMPIVWHNCGMSPELIMGLDGEVQRYPVEGITVLENLVGDVNFTIKNIDAAEAHGLAAEVCSIDKGALGAALRKIVPEPTCILFNNTPCDSQIAASQTLAESTHAPLRLVDIPYLYGDREIRYVAKQLRSLIPFMEEHTGLKFSWEKFRDACEHTNKMATHLWEWNEGKKNVPTPQMSKIVGLTTALVVVFSGDKTGAHIAQELAGEVADRIQKGDCAVEGGEAVRGIWYQDPVWFDLSFYDWLESELKMTIPMDLFGYYAPEGYIDTSSPDTMLHGLAKKFIKIMPMSRQFKGPIDIYIDDYLRMCREFKGDCGIFAGHLACKHAWGGIGLFKEASGEARIPLLTFEFDMFDPRVTSSGALQEEFSRFVNNIVLPQIEMKKNRAKGIVADKK
jgi:benzoyl-CoA reductase/2-hydroxyglutaryl-CoA dehydratase subunit BcrC/BadD/HgdB